MPLGTGIARKEALEFFVGVDQRMAFVTEEGTVVFTVKAGGADTEIGERGRGEAE
jgi:hypothetical protein